MPPNCDARNFECALNLIYPEPQCSKTDLFSDPPCFITSVDSKMKFYYTINCQFTNMTGIEDSADYPANDGFNVKIINKIK